MLDRSTYWQKKLSELNIPKLSINFSGEAIAPHQHTHATFTLNNNKIKSLKDRDSINYLISATLFYIIFRHTRDKDICIQLGTKDHAILPLRAQIDLSQRFSDFCQTIQAIHAEGINHQLPLADIHRALPFDTRLVLQNHAHTNMLLTINHVIDQADDVNLGKFIFNFSASEDGTLHGEIKCHRSIFSESEIKQMIARAQVVFDYVIDHPETIIADIPINPANELDLLTQYNATTKPQLFGNALAHEILSLQAEKTPDHIFLRFHPDPENKSTHNTSITMTYREFDEYTNQVANYLRTQCGVKEGDKVILSVQRDSNLIAFIYGILKAGGVVEPFESVGSAFLDTKLQSSEARLCVTDEISNNIFTAHHIPCINISDEKVKLALSSASIQSCGAKITAASPAYIEYSSGTSTGIPKKVTVSHGSFANLHNALLYQNYPRLLNLLCTASAIFDALFFDLAAVTSYGGTLNLTPNAFRQSISAIENISHLYSINFAALLPHIISDLSTSNPITYIISMGQAARQGDFERLLAANDKRTITNALGHTETGICLCEQVYRVGENANFIGTPIANMNIHIVDPETQALCPIGVAGEMYISGPGLAEGYLNNPPLNQKHFRTLYYDETHQRFIASDHSNPNAKRYYATGDLASLQFTQRGELSLLFGGRLGRRAKICGVLVDLDGVEYIISKHPKVKAVCVVTNQEETALFAYLILTESMKEIDARIMIWNFLKKSSLPRILFPYTLLMKTFPVTTNLKTDIKELMTRRKPEMLEPASGQSLIEKLIDIWCDILLIDKNARTIDKTIPFKNEGGDSEALVRLKLHLNKTFSLNRPITIGADINADLAPESTLLSLEKLIKRIGFTQHASNYAILMNKNRADHAKESYLNSNNHKHLL